MQTLCLSLLGVEGAHSPFTTAEAPWHSPPSILIPLSITSRSHRTPGIYMPWCSYREPWLPSFPLQSLSLIFSLSSLSAFPFLPLFVPLPSPQSSCLFLGFHLKWERAKNPVPGTSAGRGACKAKHTDTHSPSWLLKTLLHPWDRAAGKAQLSELCFHKVMEGIKRPNWNFQELMRKKKKKELSVPGVTPLDHLEG